MSHYATIAAIIVSAMLAFVLVLAGPGLLQRENRLPVRLPASNRVEQIRRLHLPNLVLTDHEGRKLRFYDDLVAGKVVAINFMYAACSKTCGLASQSMARLQEAMGDRTDGPFALYSISLDPEHDSPAALAAFRDKQGAKAGWTFLRPASLSDVTELRRKLGVYDPDPQVDGDLSSHTGMIVMGNEPKGRWSMIPALVNPVRVMQAMERVILPPEVWPRGQGVVDAVPREDADAGLQREPRP